LLDADRPVSQEPPKPTRKRLVFLPILVSLAAAIAVLFVQWWRRRRPARTAQEHRPPPPVISPGLQGLTDAEAEARRLEGQDNAIPFRPQRTRQQIIKENVFTIFNLNLVGLAFAQLLLGIPLDALISLGTIALNAGLNIVQESLARVRMKAVEEATRLQATVIREGKVHSIDPNYVVQGDILVVGPGDDLIADGELVGEGQITVDESILTGSRVQRSRQSGDKVYAGSFCVSGRAAYEAQQVGSERLIVTRGRSLEIRKEGLTPLERLIDRILRILLVIVLLVATLLLVRYFRLDLSIPTDAAGSAISVIFSIAPASLFFMIFLTYAGGSADLARLGALVNRTRAVESLAEATTLCFSKAGVLTGTHIEVESIEPPAGKERFAPSRTSQILGDYAHSMPVDNQTMRALIANFEGSRRTIVEAATFFSAFGWSALAFDDEDLRGVFVLGDPRIVEEHLVRDGGEAEEAPVDQDKSLVNALRMRLSPLGRFLRRGDASSTEDETDEPDLPVPGPDVTAPEIELQELEEREEAPKKNIFRRFAARVREALPRRESKPEETDEAEEEPEVPETVFLFAYSPQLQGLHAADGSPRLPAELIPLCYLRYTERVRAGAVETIQAFSEAGMSIKILASGSPDRTVALLQPAGLGAGSDAATIAISGDELADMDEAQLADAVCEHTVFGYVVPEQVGLLVGALRDRDEKVAFIGEGVGDVPGMRQANLSITGQGSSQAALSVADIVLLKDSAKVLLDVLNKGQRIVNGLLDVLRLYVTQMLYLTTLIIVLRVVVGGFPYISKQGTIIAVVTLSLPAVALSLWASPGILPTKDLRWLLLRFAIPGAITISAAGTIVYLVFQHMSDSMAYAQLGLIYALVGMGLMLVLFLKPPGRLFAGGAPVSGDWRFVLVVLVLLALFLLIAPLPITEQFLGLETLEGASDYAIVGAAVVGWAVVLRAIWWIMSLVEATRRSDRASEHNLASL
jgi:magnesium-transporting ATPase (P-type)